MKWRGKSGRRGEEWNRKRREEKRREEKRGYEKMVWVSPKAFDNEHSLLVDVVLAAECQSAASSSAFNAAEAEG
jgi:hypothetical protein